MNQFVIAVDHCAKWPPSTIVQFIQFVIEINRLAQWPLNTIVQFIQFVIEIDHLAQWINLGKDCEMSHLKELISKVNLNSSCCAVLKENKHCHMTFFHIRFA